MTRHRRPINVRLPADHRLKTLSRLYVDGVPLEDLAALYEANTQALGGQRWDAPNRFWATPARPEHSRVREVMEVRLNTAKWINRFRFQASMFPMRAFLQYWDDKEERWREVRDRRTRRPWQQAINHSVPARVPDGVVSNARRHYQHFGHGHWRYVQARVRPVKARRFRLVLVRTEGGDVPRDRRGRKVDYSLAVRDFQLGFEVNDPKDAPRRKIKTQESIESETFSSSTDLLGSSVSFGLREYKASDLLWPSRQALAGIRRADREHDKVVWKSEPQPFSFGVVSLYVDARDEDGEAQSIDRFYVDPLTPGVHCNLYYSNDTATGDFEASDEELRYPMVQAHGDVEKRSNGLLFDDSNTSYLDVDSQVVQWRTQRPWWMGLVVVPQFDSDEIDEHVILDSPGCSIRWVDSGWRVTINGVTFFDDTAVFSRNESVAFMLVWTGERARVRSSTGWAAAGGASGGTEGQIADRVLRRQIRLGANRVPSGSSTSDFGNGNYRLRSLVLKREALTDIDSEFARFNGNRSNYVLKPEIDDDREDYTGNALLRYHPDLQTPGSRSMNPYGFVGRPGVGYENLVWTPINRDYRLHKGYMSFDPVKAKYFKFEFTNLSPQPYQDTHVRRRKVRLFSVETAKRSSRHRRSPGGGDRGRLGGSGVQVNESLGEIARYRDMLRTITYQEPNRHYSEYTPTEAIYARDPITAQKLGSISSLYNFHPWHRSSWAPRFTSVQKHHYEVVEVEHRSKVAYFVGLKGLRMFKVDYTAADDTDAYHWHFLDEEMLDTEADTNRWGLAFEGGLTSVGILPGGSVRTTSKVLNSRRNVRGVQFATQQTPARQLLSDSEFTDPNLTHWQPYGGAAIKISDEYASDIGSTVLVEREMRGAFWGYLEQKYPTWSAIVAQDGTELTWEQFAEEDITQASAEGGVESTQWVTPTEHGRLYAAARVYVPEGLNAPLHVQIRNQSGEVLADEQIEAESGSIAEWYAAYTIGEGGDLIGRTWADVEAAYASWQAIEDSDPDPLLPDWNAVAAREERQSEPVSIRLYQSGATTDAWHVDNLSLFEDSIIWEFSNDDGTTWWPVYDIRNNPDGVFLFPDVTPETTEMSEGTNLRWRVSGYRSDQRITSLVIRPWYSTLALGVPYQETTQHGGPNIVPYDQYPRIDQAPQFKMWGKPIPEEWYFSFRQRLMRDIEPEVEEVTPVSRLYLPEAFVV